MPEYKITCELVNNISTTTILVCADNKKRAIKWLRENFYVRSTLKIKRSKTKKGVGK